jgi:hypothetical protein
MNCRWKAFSIIPNVLCPEELALSKNKRELVKIRTGASFYITSFRLLSRCGSLLYAHIVFAVNVVVFTSNSYKISLISTGAHGGAKRNHVRSKNERKLVMVPQSVL